MPITIDTFIKDIQEYMRRESLICITCTIEIPWNQRNQTPVPFYYGHMRNKDPKKQKYFCWGHFRVMKGEGVMGQGGYAAEVFEPNTEKDPYRLTINWQVQGRWKDYRIYDPEFR